MDIGYRFGNGEGEMGRGQQGGEDGKGGNGVGEMGRGNGEGGEEGGKHTECLGGMRLQFFLIVYPCNAGYPS